MGTLSDLNAKAHELLTETLDEKRWWETIRLIVGFLQSKGESKVNVEFGFVVDRNLEGNDQGKDQTVALADLETFIVDGLKQGTIEFKASADFVFRLTDDTLLVMLCNDSDIHFASEDKALALDLAHKIKATGIKVYYSGVLI